MDKGRAQAPPAPAALLPLAGLPSPMEEILQTCLEKGIDLELILQQWQVDQREDLVDEQLNRVQEWLRNQ